MIDEQIEMTDVRTGEAIVTIDEPWDLDFWTRRLAVNAGQLRRAIKRVGTRERDLAAYLGGNGRTIW